MVGSQGLYYNMDLQFELLDVKRGIDAANLARKLTEGDAKGWGSTAEHEVSKKKRAERNKLLIRNALQRGDAVYVAP